MNDLVKQAALAYAAKLVEYHEVRVHVESAGEAALREDRSLLRRTYDQLCELQNELNRAAEVVVELGLTAV